MRGGIHPLPVDSGELLRVRFIKRPNRFVVVCETEAGRRVSAHMPNPGRLRELFLPGARLLLAAPPKENPARRPTVVAVLRGERPVLLHTQWNNRVARCLLERRLVPGWEDLEVVRAEVPVGRSRFDFLLHGPGGDMLVEVKSCTLFGAGSAMFPDAVTERGRRHLLELSELSRTGQRCGVLFLAHSPDVVRFMPDYHTDPAFSQTLCAVRDHVEIAPLSLCWRGDLSLDPKRLRMLPVPWGHVERESGDRGAYWLILRLDGARTVGVGGLGEVPLKAGHYLYAGSAMRGLEARMARHLRKRKRFHWHVDYLREAADRAECLAIRSAAREECRIAAALGEVMEPGPAGFGSSDCQCATHLFYSREHPLDRPETHAVLERFRMAGPPEGDRY